MDSKMREGDSIVDDNAAKKKFKFKSFKKLFGIKKRKETLPPLGSSGLKSQSESDVTAPDSMHVDYDSEDDIEATAGVLGSRAVSHDSIFIPEIVPETVRPVRVFSQENVSDRIKALQLQLQSNIRTGPPPFGLLHKRTEDAGASSEDDGLPHSPPEISLIHDAIKTRFSDIPRHHSSLSLGGTGSEEDDQISSETSSRPLSPEENGLRDMHRSFSAKRDSASSLSPDFSSPPHHATFLDNSAARHRLSVKPRNQRSSKIRRPSAVLQEESMATLAGMEEEDVKTTRIAVQTCSYVEAETDKSDDFIRDIEDGQNVEEDKEVSSEIIVATDPQSLPEVVQDRSTDLNVVTSVSVQLENIVSATSVAFDGNINIQGESMNRSTNKIIDNTSVNLPIIEKEVCAIFPLASNDNKLLDDFNKKPSSSQEKVVPLSRTAPLGHFQDSIHSRRRLSQNSLSEKNQNAINEPLPDKENYNKLGNIDKKIEKSPTEASTQRKFSVSSAWERPRTGSFTLKGNAEGDALKNIKLSVLKPGVSKTEPFKEEFKAATTHAKNKPTGSKKETLDETESLPADKAVFSNITPKRSATTDLPVVTDVQAGTEDRNPFFVKLRSTSLSLRYRDGMNPATSTMKRHSAEIKQENTGYMPVSKVEMNTGNKDHSLLGLKTAELKSKADVIDVSPAKPALPKKPVLQNITVADNNTNKESSDCGSNQENKSKYSETKTEKKWPDRRLSLHKAIDKNTPPVVTSEPVKGVEGKAQPAWMSMAFQKQRSPKEEHPANESRIVKQESDKQNKEKAEVHLKQQTEVFQNKATNTNVVVSPETCVPDPIEPRQRANTLPHAVYATQLSLSTDKEEKNPQKRQTLSVSEEPSWMELAKKKSQAWSDMPQIIK